MWMAFFLANEYVWGPAIRLPETFGEALAWAGIGGLVAGVGMILRDPIAILVAGALLLLAGALDFLGLHLPLGDAAARWAPTFFVGGLFVTTGAFLWGRRGWAGTQ